MPNKNLLTNFIFIFFKKNLINFINKNAKLVKQILYKFFMIISYFYSKIFINNFSKKSKKINISFICEEFFHKDLRGFGGFGRIVANISSHFNLNKSKFYVSVIIPQVLPGNFKISIKRYHNAPVLLRSNNSSNLLFEFIKYIRIINKFKSNIFITIDWYPSYIYPLEANPQTPIIVWIQDPRSEEEWRKIATVALILKARKKNNEEELIKLAQHKKESIRILINLSKKLRRKIIFVTQAKCLIKRAEKTYGITLNPYLLLNPIPLYKKDNIIFSSKPSLCFLGRLDAVKRPWIVFELAKKFQNINFYIAGITHTPDLVNPIIRKYENLKNLKFLGLVTNEKKKELLKNCWGLINTSIHEALPVSFLEAFSYGKPVISCQNPDDLITKFGYYTGEILGDGLDERSLNLFSEKIEKFLKDDTGRIEKGRRAKRYVEEKHNFSCFEKTLEDILKKERII